MELRSGRRVLIESNETRRSDIIVQRMKKILADCRRFSPEDFERKAIILIKFYKYVLIHIKLIYKLPQFNTTFLLIKKKIPELTLHAVNISLSLLPVVGNKLTSCKKKQLILLNDFIEIMAKVNSQINEISDWCDGKPVFIR